MELKDTIELMTSDDYKERFKAEYYQLSIRYEKLTAMLKAWDAGTLEFKPTCPRKAYSVQATAMDDYLTVLKARAAMEGVKLEKEM